MLQYQNPDKERRNGKCPLTPEEVGLMLRALGYGKDSYLYVASGQVYNGEASLAPLKALFPNFFTKDTLVTRQELQPFAKFSSRMAAIDYVVCSESDVFVANNNGNMARILAGERYAMFYAQFLARTWSTVPKFCSSLWTRDITQTKNCDPPLCVGRYFSSHLEFRYWI